MKPYFATHPAGILYLLVLLGWYLTEGAMFLRQRDWRKTATRACPPAFWPVYWAVVAVAVIMLVLAPLAAPGATIGHGAAVFAVGMVLLVAGVALRMWSFRALGRYFTFTIKVSPDQAVVSSGPYHVLRHPGYAGGMLAIAAVGLLNGNWVSMATLVVTFLGIVLWRIRAEERALLATLGEKYRSYAAQHKRLVPLVW